MNWHFHRSSLHWGRVKEREAPNKSCACNWMKSKETLKKKKKCHIFEFAWLASPYLYTITRIPFQEAKSSAIKRFHNNDWLQIIKKILPLKPIIFDRCWFWKIVFDAYLEFLIRFRAHRSIFLVVNSLLNCPFGYYKYHVVMLLAWIEHLKMKLTLKCPFRRTCDLIAYIFDIYLCS